jgi:hypothetical protein
VERFGPLRTFLLGLRVLGSELAWLLILAMRRIEIKQMRKRLDEEYLLLGRLTRERPEGDEERELARRQVDFLGEEIAMLRDDLDARRREWIDARVARWGLEEKACE